MTRLTGAPLRGVKHFNGGFFSARSRRSYLAGFRPSNGDEQDGPRPALVLSPAIYNQATGLAIVCPITNSVKGYPFEVSVAEQSPISGAVLSDQVKSIDWKARNAEKVAHAPRAVVKEVISNMGKLLTGD